MHGKYVMYSLAEFCFELGHSFPQGKPTDCMGHSRYRKSVNPRNYVAYVVGFTPHLQGIAGVESCGSGW